VRELIWLVGALLVPGALGAQSGRLPVFDAHLHARDGAGSERPLCIPVTVYGIVDPECDDPMRAPLTDAGMVTATVAELERLNVYGVISGHPLERVQRFVRAAPDRLRPAYQFSLGYETYLSVDELRTALQSGAYEVVGEIELQYDGISPADHRMAAYWALAEELDVPVALHLGEGYPGAPYDGGYRVSLGHPFELEPVLVRHPDLRLYVMHYGSPLVDEMIGILGAYPNVYIDVGGNLWPYPRDFVYRQLRQFIEAGFGKRILFGSDQMHWPGLIEESIRVIEEAPFLSEEQKRDILYNNAARFFRLSDDEIERHYGEREARPNKR
jgi:hypothetical protein